MYSRVDTLPLTPASHHRKRKKKMQKSGFRENNTSMALFPPLPKAAAVSFTYFIIYSHVVPSKLIGVGLVFHKKAVKEAEGVEVRGPPTSTPSRGAAVVGGREPKVLSGRNFSCRQVRGSGGAHTGNHNSLPVSWPEHPP